MNHDIAERLLPSLPDGLLPARTEAAVRAHVAECPVCRRSLDELEAIDALLRRLPTSVLPRHWTPAGDARLESLARWAPVRGPHRAWPALSAFAAGASLALGLLLGLGSHPAASTDPAVSRARQPVPSPEIVLASSDAGEDHRPVRRSRPGPAPGTTGPEIYYLPVGLR
jgi:anti-sigma factor RsiW